MTVGALPPGIVIIIAITTTLANMDELMNLVAPVDLGDVVTLMVHNILVLPADLVTLVNGKTPGALANPAAVTVAIIGALCTLTTRAETVDDPSDKVDIVRLLVMIVIHLRVAATLIQLSHTVLLVRPSRKLNPEDPPIRLEHLPRHIHEAIDHHLTRRLTPRTAVQGIENKGAAEHCLSLQVIRKPIPHLQCSRQALSFSPRQVLCKTMLST